MINDDKSLAWEEISREHIVQDQWIDFRKSAYRYPDGRVFEPFYTYIERKDGREYASGARVAEQAEEALEAAKRELMEETGYVSDNWTHLITIPSNATIADNYAHIFMAKGCRLAGDQHLDETEVLNVIRCSGQEIEDMIRQGKFQQAMHVMAWLMAKCVVGDGSF